MTTVPSMRSAHALLATLLATGTGAAIIGLAALWMWLCWPATRVAPPRAGGSLSAIPLREALHSTALNDLVRDIGACGPRALGTPGLDRTADLVVARARAVGAEVFELPVFTPCPVTKLARITSVDGKTPEKLRVFPFKPNLVQPGVTPPAGLDARLQLVDAAWERDGGTGTGQIALVDAAHPPPDLGMTWSRYAARGFAGVIVTHSAGLTYLDWTTLCNDMEASTPVAFPRLAATPEVLDLAGTRIHLEVHITWEHVTHRALLARLTPVNGSTGQALVISVPYDQVSAIPDIVPAADQDLPLATALMTFATLATQRESLGRDVLLVATAGGANADDGLAYFLSAAGALQGGEVGRAWWSKRRIDLTAREAIAERLLPLARTPGFLRDLTVTDSVIAPLTPLERTTLADLQRQVVNNQVSDLNEVALQAHIAMQRGSPAPGAAPPADLLDPYILARQAVSRVSAIASWSPEVVARRGAKLVAEYHLDEHLALRLEQLSQHLHAQAAQATAAERIGAVFAGYTSVVVFEPRPAYGDGIKTGDKTGHTSSGTSNDKSNDQPPELVAIHRGAGKDPGATGQAFSELCQRLVAEGGEDAPQLKSLAGGRYADQTDGAIAGMTVHATKWSEMGYPAMALVHADRGGSYRRMTSIRAEPSPLLEASAPQHSQLPPIPPRFMRLTADLMASFASGRGEIPLPKRASIRAWSGRILASGVGVGVVPNHPLTGAVVSTQLPDRPADMRLVGYGLTTTMLSDDDGYYGVPPGPFQITASGDYVPIVAGFDADGLMRWVKDQGPNGQALYSSLAFGWNPPNPINIVAFRGDPIVVADRIDPRLLRPWAEIRPLTRDGLAVPASFAAWDGIGGLSTFFLQPDQFILFTLNAGSPENPLVRSVRSVLLGAPVPAGTRIADAQPDGLGYLAADRLWITDAAREAATSLLRLDERRMAQQVTQGLAQPGMVESVATARSDLARAAATGTQNNKVLIAERRAGALAQQNHERIQTNINQAVANIVWYLCLLVPFALFTEKLIIGASDVRRQILWAGGIFLGSFTLLAVLHPAFPLLSSPLMILLGFVIVLIAVGVSGIFLGRFQENLRSLQAGRGRVEGAGVDVLGVTVTAFLLGLNGLSRRKVRTGLTSATLVLITFALICFAGIQRADGVTVTAVGPAAYSGMLIEDETNGQIGVEEVAALRARYGTDHRVCQRVALVGLEEWRSKERGNPQLDLVRGSGEAGRTSRCSGALLWQHDEPLADRLRLVAGSAWSSAAAASTYAAMPVMISERSAEDLRIQLADFAHGPVPATLNGQSVVVVAVFASDSLAGLRDLNGRSPLPFDILAMRTIRRSRTETIMVYPDDQLLPADQVMILPTSGLNVGVPFADRRLVSCAVDLGDLSYREANELIADHQRLSGLPLAYGLDGTAFMGRPQNASTFGGIDLLIPLLIAALTVLNTMRGSVYERRDEIAVFNAVGIAPRYIAAMFFAEALVYAVVGSVAGFLLSLILGRGLALLGLDAGLKLDVASLAPVWASLALAAAVFLSTWFPARQAAQIAAPSDDAGWKMPEPDGDHLAIELPFAFDARDRVAILAFFARWFRDHGEGGAGPFQASAPHLDAFRDGNGDEGEAVPHLTARIWLKPFDQGVAQDLGIELRKSVTGDYLAHVTMTRVTGSKDAWMRLNGPFMRVLRRHFLYWRAVDSTMRADLFGEACGLLRAAATPPAEPHHVG